MARKRRKRTTSEKIMIVVGLLASVAMILALFFPTMVGGL